MNPFAEAELIKNRELVQPLLCHGCGKVDLALYLSLCAACHLRYPLSLVKATCDEFDYMLKLRSGEVFCFSSATIHGDFVTLELKPAREYGQQGYAFGAIFDRGLDVRASDIVWCADAPFGS